MTKEQRIVAFLNATETVKCKIDDDNFKKIFDNDQQQPALESRLKKVEYVDQGMPF